jgi:hypothetical protein
MKTRSVWLGLSLLVAFGKADSGGAAAKGKSDPAKVEPGKAEPAKAPEVATPPLPPAADRYADGYCEVAITGDLQKSIKAPGGLSATGSDYWYSESEMKSAVTEMEKFRGDQDLDKRVAEAMKKDPKFYTLILNCNDQDVSISLMPNGGAKHLPFSPKKYAVKQRGGTDGTFNMLSTIGNDPYMVKSDGTIDITRFDAGGIAGTFEVEATSMPLEGQAARTVKLTGKFDYKCTAQYPTCQNARGK